MPTQLDAEMYLFSSMENKLSIPSAIAASSSYHLPPGCSSHPGQASPPVAAWYGQAGRGSPQSLGSCCSKRHTCAGNSSHPHLVCGNNNWQWSNSENRTEPYNFPYNFLKLTEQNYWFLNYFYTFSFILKHHVRYLKEFKRKRHLPVCSNGFQQAGQKSGARHLAVTESSDVEN